jgi:hypothetical protein
MSQPSHAVVWMDHADAHILHYTAEDMRNKVVAIETVDHPSDGELLDYARKHFRD